MPRFHLNLDECGRVTPDDEGIDVADAAAAREIALTAARAIMSEEMKDGTLCLSCRIDVIDADGRIVLSVPFREAVTITGLDSHRA